MKNLALVGNILDRESQAGQYGQTKGIPIGPDTSLGIAEVLLSPLDKALASQCRIIGGTRFIDDMEFTFRTLAEADHAQAKLEALLSEIELQINPTKTRVIELPDRIESGFVTGLRPHVPKSGGLSKAAWIDYFNLAFAGARASPQEGVLRYAIASLQTVQISPTNWELAQELLWQCVAFDSGCLRFVMDILLNHKSTGLVIDVGMGSLAINSLIESSAVVAHGGEVVWSIWAAVLLNLNIEMVSQNHISKMDDALVAAIAMIAGERGKLAPTFDSPLWRSWITTDAFEQEYWLFAYEALNRGWFAAEVSSAKLAAHATMAFLRANKVKFIDTDAIDLYVPSKSISTSGGSGGGGGY